MKFYSQKLRSLPIKTQLVICILGIVFTAAFCYPFSYFIGYKTIALILLMVVSLAAMLFDILPVLISAALSALVWNFFFIPPKFTFHIGDTQDALLFALYFIIALLHAVLTSKLKQEESKVRDKEEKDRSIKLYNTILHSLSHEMRTPLASIIGSIDTLKDHRLSLSDSQKTELYNQIYTESDRLNHQVENLLNINRIENNMLILRKEWCDINEMIQGVINKSKPFVGNLIIDFKHKEDIPLFKLDIGMMEQVLQNVVYNASKYLPVNGKMSIDVYVKDHMGIFEFHDNGPGYPDEILQAGFQKFHRGKSVGKGGVGLGLSIIHGIVDAHNGTVSISNDPQGGAFTKIEIPSEFSYMGNLTLDT